MVRGTIVSMCPLRPMRDDFEILGAPRAQSTGPYEPNYDWETYASKYMEFTDKNPTVYHAVDQLRADFEAAGFKFLRERDTWDIQPGNKYVVTRNGTNIVAFALGKDWTPDHGALLAGSHVDSLAGVVKPSSIKNDVDGFELLGTAAYAGALSDKWWDRDLGIGGRVVVREGSKVVTKLVHVPYPIARIPSLAPHFGAPSQGPFNPETQTVPVVGISSGNIEPTPEEKKAPLYGKHSLRLLRLVARYAGVPVSHILNWDLQLFDTQPAAFGGLDKEFLFCPRVDDKICSYVAAQGLIEASDHIVKGDTASFFAGYDNEEVGSLSRNGAAGNLFEASVDRILSDHSPATTRVFYANSFFLSADVIHAVNPNFDNIYLEHHKPVFNKGVTISQDPNGHMITTGVSTAFVHEVAKRTGNEVQQFQIRNDSRSGGTIGPTLSSKVGLRGIDLGIAQWSMHSIRATVGSKDVYLGVKFFKSFNKVWHDVDLEYKLSDL